MNRRSLLAAAFLPALLGAPARAELPFVADPNRCDSSGLPAGCIPLPNEMSVLPVPHSATAAAQRASSHRLTIPMIASAWAGNGFLFSSLIFGQTGSEG